MLDRREFLRITGLAAAFVQTACVTTRHEGAWVNDIHSQLNRTWVREVLQPASVAELRAILARGRPVAVAGARHAMGGQQFATDATLVDVSGLTRIMSIDEEHGLMDVEAGAEWPAVVAALKESRWGIRQKQTGADRLSLGGAMAANAHGRGLTMKPFIDDVESFSLLTPGGDAVECSRADNAEVFRLVLGGYGLFGVVTSLRLRLSAKTLLERVVELQTIDDVMAAFDARIDAGFVYGDFQFSIEEGSDDFLRKGVFSCYRPAAAGSTMPEKQAELGGEQWLQLLYLAHADKRQAFDRYAEYYLSTNGQLYWSDEHQLSFYPDDYHVALDPMLRSARATEMISELYVPRERLADFMLAAREEIRRRKTSVIYGTVRLIRRDEESFLAWAKQDYACVIFNLHVEHSEGGKAAAADAFRALIDLALARDGSYFLTYHRWARRDQVERAYPQMQRFLAEKKRHDPHGQFQSDWYRHYEAMLSE
jgi:FAD/FMN-containing dehydrogenase